jgi:hypothetical protein
MAGCLLWSKAAICSAKRHFCFAPEALCTWSPRIFLDAFVIGDQPEGPG